MHEAESAMAAPDPSLITWLIAVPLIAWRLVTRFRRMTQRQRLTRVRPWVTLTLFPLVLYLLCMTAFVPPAPPQPHKLIWLALGVAAGAALALFGLKHTSFKKTNNKMFYTPVAKLGIALSTLFLARVVYRLGDLAVHGPRASEGLE